MTQYFPIAARFIGGKHVGYEGEQMTALGPPFPQPDEHCEGLTPPRLRATDRPIVPGNERQKAGKPSYEELEAICCGLEGERNGTKRRVVSEELAKEYAACGGVVVKDRGEIVVLCDFAAVRVHFGSS